MPNRLLRPVEFFAGLGVVLALGAGLAELWVMPTDHVLVQCSDRHSQRMVTLPQGSSYRIWINTGEKLRPFDGKLTFYYGDSVVCEVPMHSSGQGDSCYTNITGQQFDAGPLNEALHPGQVCRIKTDFNVLPSDGCIISLHGFEPVLDKLMNR